MLKIMVTMWTTLGGFVAGRYSAEKPAPRHYAQILDSTEKIAVSASGQLTVWNNTRRWASVDPDAILDLRNSPGREIVVYAAASNAASTTNG